MRASYCTKQKEKILELIKSFDREFTIKELYNQLNKNVGLTTIYRMVDRLVISGLISKSIKNNTTYYQYLEKCKEDNHFYLKCDNCGKIVHVDCDCINDLTKHVLKKHQFKVNKKNIVINGICDICENNVEVEK